ncbi:MAG: HD domain-containing protein [Desulfovibrionaceae bacterium]|nr:HD domain-containing protein [Desulfovibrionaceae bacterium]
MSKAVPQSISEEYYQISQAVLSSFPKYRLPLDLFVLDEPSGRLSEYYRKDNRLSNERTEEVQRLCEEGNLFVSRADYAVYSQHIVKQLDLVLVDKNLKEGEVSELIVRALGLKLAAFLDQPVRLLFQPLLEDCMVFTEYLWQDKYRIKPFMRRLHQDEYSLVSHSVNTLLAGTWLFLHTKEEPSRKELDALALGLLLHDVGMSKVPIFILRKDHPLKQEERDKIPPHVLAGMQIVQKMEVTAGEAQAACLEHHERLNGSGYPQHLSGQRLSVVGSLAAVADSFSAMIQKRVYAEAKPPIQAAEELMKDTARYDPRFAAALYTALFTNSF